MMTQQISFIYITSGGTEVLCSRLTVRLIAEKYVERQTCTTLHYFMDYTEAFGSLWHGGLWTVLHSFRIPRKRITLLQNIRRNQARCKSKSSL